jgi:hypothetical protein
LEFVINGVFRPLDCILCSIINWMWTCSNSSPFGWLILYWHLIVQVRWFDYLYCWKYFWYISELWSQMR